MFVVHVFWSLDCEKYAGAVCFEFDITNIAVKVVDADGHKG
jgi:hypothetical protein